MSTSQTKESGQAWTPIATAPLDGTVVDVWADGRRWSDLHYLMDRGFWGRGGWKMFRGRRAPVRHTTVFPSLKPTHWMPLPEAPALAKARGQ